MSSAPDWFENLIKQMNKDNPDAVSDMLWLCRKVLGEHWQWHQRNSLGSISASEKTQILDLFHRRIRGEPVAYILGEWEFFAERIEVGPGVLIPRAETEVLVEQVIKQHKNKSSLRFADFGAGSGCITLALLKKLNIETSYAIEKSPSAFKYLQRNLKSFQAKNVQLKNSSVESFISKCHDFSAWKALDFVVANPPYISRGDLDLDSLVLQTEPEEALFADDNGLAIIKEWLVAARSILKPGGLYYFEIGWKQKEVVEKLVKTHPQFKFVETIYDYAGRPRVVVCKKEQKNG